MGQRAYTYSQETTSQETQQEENRCAKGHTIFKTSCRACQSLKKDWDAYLKYSGFEDIEKGLMLVDHKNVLDLATKKDWQTKVQFEAKYNYYEWCRQKLNDGNFRETFPYKDQKIWEYHSEGWSRREISVEVGYENSYISRKIDRIEDFLKTHSVSSGTVQMDLLFFGEVNSSEP